jgi:sucrose phosphorylase
MLTESRLRRSVHLVTYADRLAGDLSGLRALLTGPLAGRFDGVHVLPFFTPIDGADAGFDPDDHRVVDARLGDWDDVAALAGEVDVTVDLIVNHVSTRSPEFHDFHLHGERSEHAGLFLTLDRVFPDGATEHLLGQVYRPRPGLPLTAHTLADGTRRVLWTTFTSEQVDLDVQHPSARQHLDGLLALFARHGVRCVRLDAVGYAVKTAGTSSFMTADTAAFLAWLCERAHAHGIATLVEVHAHWRLTEQLAAASDLTYDFALPPLVLDALHTGDTAPLHRWLGERPHNVVSVLDTHDGIGVIDVGANAGHGGDTHPGPGLLSPERIDALVESIHAATGGVSRRATGAAASNVDLYQVNTTYLDALGGDVDAMLAARALQLLLPGIPQLYYVGLLMGRNDVALLEATGVGRDVNRHHFTAEEVAAALDDPAVQRLLTLVDVRRTHPALEGTWWLAPHDTSAPHLLTFGWRAAGAGEPAGEPAGERTLVVRLDARARRAELEVDGVVVAV